MAFVGIRELSRDTSRVIREFEDSGEPVIITREGQPIGALTPVTKRQVEDIVLATAPEFRPVPRDESAAPPRLRPLSEYAAERGIEIEPAEEEDEGQEGQVVAATWRGERKSLSAEAVVAELAPYGEALSETMRERLISDASAAIATANDEALAALGQGQIDPDAADAVSVVAANLYGRVFRTRLNTVHDRVPVSDADVITAGRAAGLIVQNLSRTAMGVSNHSFDGYVGTLQYLGRHFGKTDARATTERVAGTAVGARMR